MKDNTTKVLIVTPLILPSVGGGAIYTKILTSGLIEKEYADNVVVLTEKHPSCPSIEYKNDAQIINLRYFPFRAGVKGKDLTKYVKYVYQNVQFFLIFYLIKKYDITHIIIHSYFHNYPSIMDKIIYLLSKLSKIKLIADVRDPRLPKRRFKKLYYYDNIICCSENVYQRFEFDTNLKSKLTLIPIVIDIPKITHKDKINNVLSVYQLSGKRYLFNGSGIDQKKGIHKALSVVEELRKYGEDISLVIAGKKRDWDTRCQKASDSGILQYLGTLPHNDVLALATGSVMDINLSIVDSMPRHSLEALASGARALFPYGIPEFERTCHEYVAVSNNPVEIAVQIKKLINENNYCCKYDFKIHYKDNVLAQYAELLSQ